MQRNNLLNLRTNRDGRWYNDVRVWRISPAGQPAQPVQPARAEQPVQPQQAPPPSIDDMPAEDDSNDLPF